MGEVLFTSPIFIVAYFLNIWFEYILIVLCLSLYKLSYEYGYHTQPQYCVMISYMCFIICLTFAYVFPKQYILTFVLCNIICYVNYKVGILQYKASRFDIIKEPYEKYRQSLLKPKVFNLNNCTEEELLIELKKLKVLPKYYDFLIDVFVHNVRVVDYMNSPKNKGVLIDEQQLRNLKSRITKQLRPPKI